MKVVNFLTRLSMKSVAEINLIISHAKSSFNHCLLCVWPGLPWSQRFFFFFPMRVLRSGEHESRSGEKEKPLVTLDLNLTSMQMPAVKRVKFIITKWTNGKSAIMCLSTVPSVLPIKQANHIDLRVCKNINQLESEGQILTLALLSQCKNMIGLCKES